MLTKEENDRLTGVGPGTPGGAFLRRYWIPAALSEELPAGGAPIPVRLLGEDLVLFRDETGKPGLLGIHCSHRGADLSYGRIEDGGLRCLYHGWLYDRAGRCLEQPGEPAMRWSHSGGRNSIDSPTSDAQPVLPSSFRERIRHPAYPCIEQAGIIFAYMGPGEPPLFPSYEFLRAPDRHVFATKYLSVCNYVQGNEGNFDPQHLSFLHRIFTSREDFRQAYHAGDVCPTIDPVETNFGLHLYAVRKVRGDEHFVKVRSFIMPSAGAVASRGEAGYNVNWHVPIDDEHHWRYSITFSRTSPIDAETVRRERSGMAENYRLQRNKANRYLQDREEMRTETFIGMGRNFAVHDTFATEGEGPIYDRTVEHLGYTDRGIIVMRKLMLQAIKNVESGIEPLGVAREPAHNHYPDLVAQDDVLSRDVPWRGHWKRQEEREVAGARR
ncbi:MAG: Rieske 2Fe-2S domain-containing protein [Chloroflexi bacterium]|nr:Rieske 2Fe-2S domain-containing protein [Chloroflexota bacterium]